MRMGARSALIGRFLLVAEEPENAAVGGHFIGNRSWNAQLHFRARSDFTPDIELCADLLGALPHAWQTPMSVTSRVQELRINALSVIPDAQPKKPIAVSDIRFDLACVCMAERISQRLARNAVNVVAKDRMQFSRPPLYRNAERCGAPL